MGSCKSWQIAWVPRGVAMLLAIGGTFWGVFLLAMFGIAALIPFPFGVGYVITAGYIARAIWSLPFGYRSLLWSASPLVQGSWLALIVGAALPRFVNGGRFNEPMLFVGWWTFATVASFIALLCESEKEYA